MTDQVDAKGRVSRRSFFKKLGAGVLATALAAFDRQGAQAEVTPTVMMAVGQGAGAEESPMAAVALWSKATFAARVGQQFMVSAGGAPVSLKLIKVLDGVARIYRSPKKIEAGREDACFQLVFTGPRNRVLREGTYPFQHSKLGKFSLFIGPGLVSTDGQHYTAIINRVNL